MSRASFVLALLGFIAATQGKPFYDIVNNDVISPSGEMQDFKIVDDSPEEPSGEDNAVVGVHSEVNDISDENTLSKKADWTSKTRAMRPEWWELGKRAMKPEWWELGKRAMKPEWWELGKRAMKPEWWELGKRAMKPEWWELGKRGENKPKPEWWELERRAMKPEWWELGKRSDDKGDGIE